VAVRCPDHPVALALLFHLGSPLVGPSANVSGGVSPTTAEHVREAFLPEDVFVLDGGACLGGIESTVVDLSGPSARVVRPGLIGPEEIGAVLGRTVEWAGAAHGDGVRATPHAPLISPGLMARHYAPRTPARLYDAGELGLMLRGVTGGRGAVVLTHEEEAVPPPHRLIRMPGEAEAYARGLYAALREADGLGASVILIRRVPGEGAVWRAIADRLGRATVEG
jgi:L-threonylcarbamoyladenylate synthase